MNSELPSPPFSALPVRRRETLEIFDTALKLYRRYFWVLLAWSAIVAATLLTSFLSNFLYLLAAPLLYGSISCCVAAAVRGQSVGFKQCWQFSKPRYGAMLGVIFLSALIFFAVLMVLVLGCVAIGFGGVALLSNAPQPVQIVGSIVGVVGLFVVGSIASVVAFGWLNMVPIVACLEDDKRGTAAMGRAFDLLKGNWSRVFGMSLLLGLAVLVIFAILGGICAVLFMPSLRELVGSNGATNNGMTSLLFTVAGFYALFFLLWNPAQNLVIAVLYLDLRVRREALDLEWTAYSSAPTPAVTFAGAPVNALNETNQSFNPTQSGAVALENGALETLAPAASASTFAPAVSASTFAPAASPSTFGSPAATPSTFAPQTPAAPFTDAPASSPSPEASSPEASSLEASSLEASSLEASSLEASSLEASSLEASSLEASSLEASSLEASSLEASSLEASSPEAPLAESASNGSTFPTHFYAGGLGNASDALAHFSEIAPETARETLETRGDEEIRDA